MKLHELYRLLSTLEKSVATCLPNRLLPATRSTKLDSCLEMDFDHKSGTNSRRDSTSKSFPSSTEPLKGIAILVGDNFLKLDSICKEFNFFIFYFLLFSVNIDNHVGAVGFISRIMPFIYPVTLIKVDEVTGEPIREVVFYLYPI